MRLTWIVAFLALGGCCIGIAAADSLPAASPASTVDAVHAPAPLPVDAPALPALGAPAVVEAPAPSAARVGIAAAGGVATSFLGVAGIALYHRIRPTTALENETRKQIFDAVCSQPGLGVHAIARTAAVSYSTATYHLERLVDAGMLVMTPDGNKLCYYKNGGAFTENERRILPLVKNEEAAKLLEAIMERPGTYRAELAEKLGVTATTINWHLKRLREAGLIEETRMGRNAYLYARTEPLRVSCAALALKVSPQDAISERLRRYSVAGA